MAVQTREIYSSPNGDRWILARDLEANRVFIQHEANLASGGRITIMEVGEFLGRPGQPPEKQELLRLIGSLIEGAGSEVRGGRH